jgi:hypothetical protein
MSNCLSHVEEIPVNGGATKLLPPLHPTNEHYDEYSQNDCSIARN